MMRMRALQVVQPRQFELVQVPFPALHDNLGECILVKPEWVSLCGSDIPFFTGSKPNRSYPLPAGAPIHECVGRVIDSSSSQFNWGERVLAIPEADLGLAEYFIARASKAVTLPEDLDDFGAACLIQPLCTVMNALDRLGSVDGQSVLVMGLGSIGLFFCWLLKQRGAAYITGIDPSEKRCKMAEQLGASTTMPCRGKEVVQSVRQGLVGWQSPDICIEAVGHQMDTLNDCLELVRKRGTVLAFGVPDQPVYTLEYETFFRKNTHLVAVVTPDWSEYLPKSRELFLANQETLSKWITHRLSIHEAAQVFSLYETHEDGIVKAIMDTSQW
jgi:L-iditol 2-dehydrogenase